MIQGFYSAAVGAQQQMLRMNVHSNNISNVNTYGFKRQAPAFQALMYGMLDGISGDLPRGSGTLMALTGTDMSNGAVDNTGRDLDFAIVGDGFFALYEPGTGEVSFTRDGAFTVAEFQELANADAVQQDGADPVFRTVHYLSDGEGRQVLDSNGYAIVMDERGDEQPDIGVFTIQFMDGLERVGSSRFIVRDKNGVIQLSDAQVRRGVLEASNTDLATELTSVIEAQRSYSLALKVMTTSDEVETTINNLANG